MVLNNSSPVPLTPGDWYLGVVRRVTNALTYSVRASHFTSFSTNLLITDCRVVSNTLSLCWTNMPMP
jgi:hypothetical protein